MIVPNGSVPAVVTAVSSTNFLTRTETSSRFIISSEAAAAAAAASTRYDNERIN